MTPADVVPYPTLAHGLPGTGGRETSVWQDFRLTLSLKKSRVLLFKEFAVISRWIIRCSQGQFLGKH